MIETIISSSVLIIMIILLRFLLRGRIKNSIIYALWLIAAVRLLIPFGLPESSISIMNLPEHHTAFITEISAMTDAQTLSSVHTNSISEESNKKPVYNEIENNSVMHQNREPAQQIEEPIIKKQSFHWHKLMIMIWLVGIFGLLLWFLIVNCMFYTHLRKHRVRCKIRCAVPVYVVENLGSPCIFGIRKPAIYLNRTAIKKKSHLNYIISHELCHYRHGDLLWSVLRCFLISVYWFHPLVWIAAYLSKQDCECACDESVMKNLNHKQRMEYGKTLLSLVSTSRMAIMGTVSTSMTSKGKQLKERMMFIVQKPKTSIPALVILISVLFIITGCTFTSAAQNHARNNTESQDHIETGTAEGMENVRSPTETTMPIQTDTIVTATQNTVIAQVTNVPNTQITTYVTVSTEESENKTTEVSQTTDNLTSGSSDNTDEKTKWENYAYQKFQIASYTYFNAIVNGTYYETNYNTMRDERGIIFNEVSDSRVSTISDIKTNLKNIFSESYVSQHDNRLNTLYQETDGKLYQSPCGKGGVFSMEDIKIELISANSNKIEFNASLYSSAHDYAYLGTKPFILVYENGDWKVDEFTEPELYNAPEMYRDF